MSETSLYSAGALDFICDSLWPSHTEAIAYAILNDASLAVPFSGRYQLQASASHESEGAHGPSDGAETSAGNQDALPGELSFYCSLKANLAASKLMHEAFLKNT